MKYSELKIVEAISTSQYRSLVKGWNKQRYGDIFLNPKYRHDRNGYRVYIPLNSTPKEQPQKSPTQQQIEEFLEQNGFSMVDYVKGIVHNTEKRQDIKIGKVLNKLKRTDLLNAFNVDKTREATQSQYIVVISRHPYDIAGQSTGRGWTSCMNLEDGINKHYVPLDIREGTLVAYVTSTDDLDLKNPTGRVSIKPFVDVLGRPRIYFGIEDNVYGTNVAGFVDAVSAWVEEVNAAHELDDVAILKFNDKLYKDSSLANQTIVSKKGISDQERETLSDIAHRPSSVLRMENPTEEQLSIAIINDRGSRPSLFKHIVELFPDAIRSQQIQQAAVSKQGENLEIIIDQGITPVNAVINTAIARDPEVILYLKKDNNIKITKDMLETVIHHNTRLLYNLTDYLGLLDRDLIQTAIQKYPTVFDLFVKNKITMDRKMVITALAHNYPDMSRMILYCIYNKIPLDQNIVKASMSSHEWFEKHIADILSYNMDYPESPIPLSTDQIVDAIERLYKHSNYGQTKMFLENLSTYGVTLDDKTLFEIIKKTKNVSILKHIKQDISEELANKCLSISGAAIEFIAAPTPQQQMLAVETTPSAIDRIKNPTEQALAVALRKYPNAVTQLKNPTFESFMLAVEHHMPKVRWSLGDRDLLPNLDELLEYMEDAELSDEQILQVLDRAIKVEPNRIFDLMRRDPREYLTDQMMFDAVGKTHVSITASLPVDRLAPMPVILQELKDGNLTVSELIRHVNYYNEDAAAPITFDRKIAMEILNSVKDKKKRSQFILSAAVRKLLAEDNDMSSLLKYALTYITNPVSALGELVKRDIKLTNSAITTAFKRLDDVLSIDRDFNNLINKMIEKDYDLSGVVEHFIDISDTVNFMATVMISSLGKLFDERLKIKILKKHPGLLSLITLVGDKSPPTEKMKEISAQGGFWEPLKTGDMVRLGNPKATPKNKILRVLPAEYEIEKEDGSVIKFPRARIHKANSITPPSGYTYPSKESE